MSSYNEIPEVAPSLKYRRPKASLCMWFCRNPEGTFVEPLSLKKGPNLYLGARCCALASLSSSQINPQALNFEWQTLV